MGFVAELWRDAIINGIARTSLVPRGFRTALLRSHGIRISEDAIIAPGVWFGGNRITIGRGSRINYGCFLDNSEEIRIGSNVALGMQVTIVTSGHRIGPSRERSGPLEPAPVLIDDGVWIGARAVILPGVRLKRGCVIAAGSVVARDCDADTLYAGVPARAFRALSNDLEGDESLSDS